MHPNFYIAQNDFRVYLPDVQFVEKSGDEEAYNSRQMKGAMSTSSEDRQGERVLAKGLILDDFLTNGHFNDNHSQDTSAIVGYPEEAYYSKDIVTMKGNTVEGWLCRGYVLKGTQRADGIWELAKALSPTPRRLGFSIEGKVIRRKNNVIEKALIRNCAITNCPVNVDATWDVLAKSFTNSDVAKKAMMAGYGAGLGPSGQSGGSALGHESLESDLRRIVDEAFARRKKTRKSLPTPEEVLKAMDYVLEVRPDFSEEAAAEFVHYLIKKELSHV